MEANSPKIQHIYAMKYQTAPEPDKLSLPRKWRNPGTWVNLTDRGWSAQDCLEVMEVRTELTLTGLGIDWEEEVQGHLLRW